MYQVKNISVVQSLKKMKIVLVIFNYKYLGIQKL